MLDPVDGSQYGEWHSQYHPFLRDFQKRFGYYDLFLVDAETGRIVYSVFKELDFATSLIDGPCAKSRIGEVFRKANQPTSAEFVAVSDFDLYLPSYQDPAAFIASPIFAEGEKTGGLILQMPINGINCSMNLILPCISCRDRRQYHRGPCQHVGLLHDPARRQTGKTQPNMSPWDGPTYYRSDRSKVSRASPVAPATV